MAHIRHCKNTRELSRFYAGLQRLAEAVASFISKAPIFGGSAIGSFSCPTKPLSAFETYNRLNIAHQRTQLVQINRRMHKTNASFKNSNTLLL